MPDSGLEQKRHILVKEGVIMSEVEQYWRRFAQQNQLVSNTPDSWMFGDGTERMGNELGSLVVEGVKTGTCSSLQVYELEQESYPEVGQYDIVLDGKNRPLAIIQYTNIEIIPMNKVTEEFAKSEGEGDLSYSYWYAEHEKFFTWELGLYGLSFSPDMLLVCQNFKVVDIYEG